MRPDITRMRSAKRPGDDAADIERFQQFAGDLANRVQPLQPEFLLVGGDLEDTVRRRVADRLPGQSMLIAELGDDLCAGRMAISKNARKCRTLAQLRHNLLGEARDRAREISPVEWNGYAG